MQYIYIPKHAKRCAALGVFSSVVILSVCYFFFIRTPNLEETKIKYNANFGVIDQKLISFGINTESDPKSSGCGKHESEQGEVAYCATGRELTELINDTLVDRWKTQSVELDTLLMNSGWQRLPNYDPVTKDPVNTLPRLLEYKGVYDADVTYEKSSGHIDCGIGFYVTPANNIDNSLPTMKIGESCSSSYQ